MNTYKITYISPRNIFQGEVFTKAKSSPDAMSKFFEWLQEQSVWSHLWSIEIKIEQIENGSWI
jgi:hypothetical protein